MELGEFYLLVREWQSLAINVISILQNADFAQATALLIKARSLFVQGGHSETSPELSTASDDDGRYRQIEGSHQDPDQRISNSRLEALLRAAGHDSAPFVADGDMESLASRLGGFPIPVCPYSTLFLDLSSGF